MKMSMVYIDVVLRYFNQEDYKHREDVAILVSEIFDTNPEITFDEFKKEIKNIRRDFFRINRINREEFASTIYTNLVKVKKERQRSKESRHTPAKKQYDVFICHAREDKERFVRELAETLRKKGLRVWYDEFTLSIGDSLRREIDKGLSDSHYGIVVLSESFFKKDWPQRELDGLVAKEGNFNKVILPIWHGVTQEQVASFSPMLAGRLAASSDKGMDLVVKEILRAIKLDNANSDKNLRDVRS